MNDLDKFRQEWLDEVASRTVAKGSDGSLLSKSQIQDPKDLTEIEALVEQTENTSISNLALDKKANDDNDENSDNSNEANGKRPPRSALSATVHAPPSSTLDKDSVFRFMQVLRYWRRMFHTIQLDNRRQLNFLSRLSKESMLANLVMRFYYIEMHIKLMKQLISFIGKSGLAITIQLQLPVAPKTLFQLNLKNLSRMKRKSD